MDASMQCGVKRDGGIAWMRHLRSAQCMVSRVSTKRAAAKHASPVEHGKWAVGRKKVRG